MKNTAPNNEHISFLDKCKRLLLLFWTFFKLGITCFGGGYAMIALIEREVVERKKWITSNEMLDIVAIAESTPGPISINSSTYIGYKQGGILGALASTFGVVLPSFIIIFAISFFMEEFQNKLYISYALKGMRIAALVLIFTAVLNMFKKFEKTIFGILILIGAFCVTYFTDFGIIYTLLICAGLGIIYNFISRIIKYVKGANGDLS